MKLNAGIITKKLQASRAFYTQVLGFGVTFENDFYLLMHTHGKQYEISFLLPGHPSQDTVFHQQFDGMGVYLTLEIDDVDSMYNDLKSKGVEIKVELRDEPWGDRHFAIVDPNGVMIDIVQYN
ncbi:MAG: VOC family protein [Balneolaceae bacterium]|nr:VOC family protein [Balneolaceae bacterium]